MIYNPYLKRAGINAAVMTMGVRGEDYAELLRPLFKLTNIRGALITMPHKVTTARLLDEVTTAVRVSGSCKVKSRHFAGHSACPLYPRKRTCAVH
jgi:shikimate dehydrogenase